MFKILLNPNKAERGIYEIVFIAFFYSSLSLLISYWIFPELVSIVAVAFTVFSCLYITQGILKKEQKKEVEINEKSLLKRHANSMKFFLALFIGITLAFVFWTYILNGTNSQQIFSMQEQTINQIKNNEITGNAINSGSYLKTIIFNNLQVIFISLIISIAYGAGGIFVLTWNASIMGYVIGSLTKQYGLHFLPSILTKYFLHGIPEMISYIAIILAGGLIYTSIIKKDFKEKTKRNKILLDIFILISISIFLMLSAAMIETYISPWI